MVADGKAVSVTVPLKGGDFKIVGKQKRKKSKVTKWTAEQVAEFRQWHETRISELGYPADVQQELRVGREQFLGAVLP